MSAVCLLIALGLQAVAEPLNLIDNPGFESELRAWSPAFGPGAQIDREVFHSGGASARIAVMDEIGGIDSAALIVGRDIIASETHRVSAWIKCGGIAKGDFGGRVYCYAPDGEVLAMHTFGGLGAGALAGDWRPASLDLSPDGPAAIPPDTQRVVVRFSVWSADLECSGTVWVDDVSLTALGPDADSPPPEWLRRSDSGTALVLDDDLPTTGAGSDPAVIARMLGDIGFAVNRVDAARLCAPEALNPRWVDLVVLPHSGAFPADARDAFIRYAHHGGSFITLGGLPFERLVRHVDGRWLDAGEVVTDEVDAAAVASFDTGEMPTWNLAHAGESDRMNVRRDGPGAADSTACARLSCDLQAYAYGGLSGGAPGPEHAVFCFRARGDAETGELAVELQADDGSRWKRVVPLAEQWRFFAIPAREFLAYASESRGGPKDHLQPETVTGAWLGITVGMVGRGAHTFWLDEVQWRRAVTDAGAPCAPVRPSPWADLTLAAFGTDIKTASAPASIPIFTPERRFENARELGLSRVGGLDRRVARGGFSGYLATAATVAPAAGGGRGLRLGGPSEGRLVPLLDAYDADGNSLGAVGAAYLPAGRSRRGSVWAFFGVENADLIALEGDAFASILARVADLSVGGPAIQSAEMEFAVIEGVATAQVRVLIRGRVPHESELRLSVRARSGGNPICQSVVALGAAGSVEIPLSGLRPTAPEYEIEIALLDGEAMLDCESLAVDAGTCFLQVVDWLLETQREDGTFSGIAFQDNRAARGLLGAYEITGEQRYRESAIRWGEETMRLQREDGGYRMGYGITAKGEACYVADGGEIAIAVARLTSYTQGELRRRLIESLRAYMGYREEFRQTSGAIGVGWCLNDYGLRPITPLQKPTRIYAGERNAYTIGCTLAAACAYARITGEAPDRAMALRDTQWLLDHYTSLSGAAVESAFWAHHYIADEALKRSIEEHLNRSFRKRIVQPGDRSWLGGGGRSVLDLDAIAYWRAHLGPDPQMDAALARWLYALCGSNSTSAARELLRAENLNQAEKRFLCFLSVALADAVRPMVSMVEF